jgi:flavin reductase (DIM6/NTAB) family NADH-FMN oxidoreductase RutF
VSGVAPAPRPSAVSADAFKAAMAELPAGVTVVTAWSRDGAPVGATVSAVTSLSLSPPMVLACLATTSDTLQALEPGSPLTVHILADGQQDVAARLAGKGPDKFARLAWRVGGHGLPELEGSAVVTAGRVRELVPGGDHVVVLVDVDDVQRHPGRAPLVFHRRRMVAADVPDPLTDR